MFLNRRNLVAQALTLSVLGAAGLAQAADWPTRPIRLVVPFSAGGANDLMARSAAEGASKILGQPVVIDNRPGAGGTVGADIVAKAQPDGYTLLVSAAGVISNSMIKKTMPFKDDALQPVVMIGLAPSVIVVPKNAPYNNLRDFVEASKKGAGFNFATAGTGSTPHFVAEMLNVKYGAKLQPVPYKSGSESTTAVLGGQVEGTSEASIIALPHIIHEGKSNLWPRPGPSASPPTRSSPPPWSRALPTCRSRIGPAFMPPRARHPPFWTSWLLPWTRP